MMSFWVYRGSLCLLPIFENVMKQLHETTNLDQLKSLYRYIHERLTASIDRNEQPKLRNLISTLASTIVPKTSVLDMEKFGNKISKLRSR